MRIRAYDYPMPLDGVRREPDNGEKLTKDVNMPFAGERVKDQEMIGLKDIAKASKPKKRGNPNFGRKFKPAVRSVFTSGFVGGDLSPMRIAQPVKPEA